MPKLKTMVFNFESQLISNPIEQAQLKLKLHRERGTNSTLSIFEVANLMDTILFSKKEQTQSHKANQFQVFFN